MTFCWKTELCIQKAKEMRKGRTLAIMGLIRKPQGVSSKGEISILIWTLIFLFISLWALCLFVLRETLWFKLPGDFHRIWTFGPSSKNQRNKFSFSEKKEKKKANDLGNYNLTLCVVCTYMSESWRGEGVEEEHCSCPWSKEIRYSVHYNDMSLHHTFGSVMSFKQGGTEIHQQQ